MITIIAFEDVERIGKDIGYNVSNKGSIEFLISKIKSIKPSNNVKRDIAGIAGNIWYGIIANHPFLDGNKRTATEAMKLFLYSNNVRLIKRSLMRKNYILLVLERLMFIFLQNPTKIQLP